MSSLDKLLFSCEFLSPQDLIDKQAVKLLAETDTYCALKVSKYELCAGDYKQLLFEFRRYQIEDHLLPWPLLPIKKGYYPNEKTVDDFADLIQYLLDWYVQEGFQMPEGIIIDLEPSTDPKKAKKATKIRNEQGLTKSTLEGNLKDEQEDKQNDDESHLGEDKATGSKIKQNLKTANKIRKFVKSVKNNMNEERFNEAAAKFAEIQRIIRKYGTKGIAVALPLAYEDLTDGKLKIQDYMTCPITHPDLNWDMINFMIFNTDYVAASKKIISHKDYRHLIYEYATDFLTRWDAEKASITLGITNLGVQDTRAVQTDAKIYQKEVSALLKAGMTNVGIYALDGVLEQKNPLQWIQTVKNANPKDFEIDPERLEFARMVRKLFQAVDFLSPVIEYAIESGKYRKIIRKLLL